MSSEPPYQHAYDIELNALIAKMSAAVADRRFSITFLEPTVADIRVEVLTSEGWRKDPGSIPVNERIALYRRRKAIYSETGRVWDAVRVHVPANGHWTAEFTDRI